MPSFKRTSEKVTEIATDVLVVGAFDSDSGPELTEEAKAVDEALDGALSTHLSRVLFRDSAGITSRPFEGKTGVATMFPAMGRIRAGSVTVVGLGKRKDYDPNSIRRAVGSASRISAQCIDAAIALPPAGEGSLQAAVEGFILGSYRFSRFKGGFEQCKTERLSLAIEGVDQEIERGRVSAEATNWARDVINEPSGNRGPAGFAELVEKRAADSGISVEVLDERELEKRKMNGILGVGRGSDRPPRFVILRYEPKGGKGLVAVVGKGITFDSGGLSLKTAEGMETMKTDCSGAAAVAAAVTALPELGIKTNVIAALPLAENMPSGTAIKPGDVIVHYGGRTSEVVNTDAEGRLVLADALAWVAEQKPDAIIDLATLTGGMMIALGPKVAGYFVNQEPLIDELSEAANAAGERIWQMPLLADLRENIGSEIADVKNSAGTRYGSPIYGALFLEDFVGDIPWIHVDIAGPARSDSEQGYVPKGATGFGTRLLIEWIRRRSSR